MATIVGVILGLMAGYYAGMTDIAIMRAVDIMYAFPNFLTAPHLAIYPSIVLGLTMIAFNFLGDGLRDALDPRMKK
jgi:ABC-type dipeptide/oligopeptide/nickel transport system permease subunit